MAVTGTHHGMPLSIDDLDIENLAYFQYCADHEFRLQRCVECRQFRYPPGTACPRPSASMSAAQPCGDFAMR